MEKQPSISELLDSNQLFFSVRIDSYWKEKHRSNTMRKIKSVATFALVLMSYTLSAQSNALLERDFWKTRPSLEVIAKKINQGNDPSELNRFAFDPLIYAILEKAPMETLLFLLNQEGNDVNKITHEGRTYVFWAAYKGNLALMKHLVEKGAAVDIVDEHGYSLLNFAAVTGLASAHSTLGQS
jgi:ankyrin repeat protein